MHRFADVKGKADLGRFAKGGTEFMFNGIPFMTLASNPTPYNAVNLLTGDLTTMKDRDQIDGIKGRVRE